MQDMVSETERRIMLMDGGQRKKEGKPVYWDKSHWQLGSLDAQRTRRDQFSSQHPRSTGPRR